VGELVAEFQRLEERCSRHERLAVWICNLLHGLALGQARLANHLDEAIGQLSVELAARQEADTKLEALRTSAARVWDLVLDDADGSSSLDVSLSIVVELLEGRIDSTAANGVCWGTQSVLVVTLSHFLELKSELELRGFGHNRDLIEDQTDALWSQVRAASDSLALHVPPSIASSPPDDAAE
jgi:hypothetical protein